MSLAVIHRREWNAGCKTYHEDNVTNFSYRRNIDLSGDEFLDVAAIEGGEPGEELRNSDQRIRRQYGREDWFRGLGRGTWFAR